MNNIELFRKFVTKIWFMHEDCCKGLIKFADEFNANLKDREPSKNLPHGGAYRQIKSIPETVSPPESFKYTIIRTEAEQVEMNKYFEGNFQTLSFISLCQIYDSWDHTYRDLVSSDLNRPKIESDTFGNLRHIRIMFTHKGKGMGNEIKKLIGSLYEGWFEPEKKLHLTPKQFDVIMMDIFNQILDWQLEYKNLTT